MIILYIMGNIKWSFQIYGIGLCGDFWDDHNINQNRREMGHRPTYITHYYINIKFKSIHEFIDNADNIRICLEHPQWLVQTSHLYTLPKYFHPTDGLRVRSQFEFYVGPTLFLFKWTFVQSDKVLKKLIICQTGEEKTKEKMNLLLPLPVWQRS